MRQLILLFILSINSNLFAQHNNPQIFITSLEFVKDSTITNKAIKKIKRADWTDKIIVLYNDGKKIIFSSDSLWGFRDNEGNVIRSFGGELYNLQQYDSLCIYSIYHTTGKVSYTNYFFSKTLNSKIFPLTKTNIKEELNKCSCILEEMKKERQMLEIDYAAYDKVKKTYKIVAVYRSCNQ